MGNNQSEAQKEEAKASPFQKKGRIINSQLNQRKSQLQNKTPYLFWGNIQMLTLLCFI